MIVNERNGVGSGRQYPVLIRSVEFGAPDRMKLGTAMYLSLL